VFAGVPCPLVATGTLSGFTSEQAEAVVAARGGKSPGAVSAKTTALVVGEGPGAAKLARVTSPGMPVIDDERFVELLKTGELG
jgi:DNA ligase (NAD+)